MSVGLAPYNKSIEFAKKNKVKAAMAGQGKAAILKI